MYSTFNEGKAVVIERLNGTQKKKIIMWKYFTANNTRFYLDALDQMVNNLHSTIKMAPKEASKDINRGKIFF